VVPLSPSFRVAELAKLICAVSSLIKIKFTEYAANSWARDFCPSIIRAVGPLRS
jgi:hypothetical protein